MYGGVNGEPLNNYTLPEGGIFRLNPPRAISIILARETTVMLFVFA